MSQPNTYITIPVDLTNPGQFFACCGLLELADRLWSGAEGWFHVDGETFCLVSTGHLRELLSILLMDPPTEILRLESNDLEVRPIIAPLAFSFDGGSTVGLILDAWTRIVPRGGVVQVEGNPPWNFWSGQQTSAIIWRSLRAELAAQLPHLNFANTVIDLFSHRLLQKGRFGFDPAPAWNALDVGFSPNDQGLEVASSPAVELLAAIGLQRFRPVLNDNRDGFDYYSWHRPYAPAVAAAAMSGAIRDEHSVRYRASISSRGQYAALGFAYPTLQGVTHE
jgi:CRISPR-associated protein Csx14